MTPAESGHTVELSCRVCGQNELHPVLDLGLHPLANALVPAPHQDRPIEYFPLHLARCRGCGLIQILETVNPAKLFNEYLYFSSYSQVLVDNARGLSRQIIERHKLNKSNLIVEIGSNDGYLLQFYKEAGLRVLGVDAAMNVAKVAVEQRGIPTKVGFFDESIAKTILCQEGRARIIHANNVLAHTASLHSVIAGISMLLEDSGIGVFEFAYAPDMVKTGAFDLIYHEHLCYYSLETFDKLLRLHDLAAFDVEHIDTHGGSLRVYASRPQAFPSSRRLLALRKEEQADGIDTESFYSGFAESVRELKSRVTQFLSELESQGKRVAAYGAAAKATVMLNYFEITNRQIPFLADRSPHKQGLFIPGADIPICHPDRIIKDKPDYLLISAWNLKDEIIWQMKHVREWGGRFLVFLPKIEIIP